MTMTMTMDILLTITMLLLMFPFQTVFAMKPEPENELPPYNVVRILKYDIIHTKINIKLDLNNRNARGVTSITLSPLLETNEIHLDAGKLTINSIEMNDGIILDHTYDGGDKNDGLVIKLNRNYKPGEEITVNINYETNHVNETDPNNLWGSYGKGLRFFKPTTTEPRKRKQVWSSGEPEGNRYWFPCFDSPNELFTSELIVTAEKPLTIISSGNLYESKDNEDGTCTYHWIDDKPHASHRIAFVAGEYVDLVKHAKDGVWLHNYTYPDEADATIASTERLSDMMDFFSEYTGVKFPYESYRQVFVQELPWGGVHNPGFSTISENMIDDFGTHADFFYLWDGVEAHDLAAQWFANLVTPVSWEHAWLGKSMARCFDGIYCEYKNGRDEYLLYNHLFDLGTYQADWNAGIIRPIVTKNYDDPATMVTDNYAVIHGASVLNFLRKQLGEENWKRSINHYLQNNAGKNVDTDKFRKAIEDVTGESMENFFDQWIYKTGHPVFEVTKKYSRSNGQLILTVKQTQKENPSNKFPQVRYFEGKMQIGIDEKIEEIRIMPKEVNVYTFNLKEEPKIVNFDVGSSWIKEIIFKKTADELIHQFKKDSDILGRQWAMKELAGIYKNDSLNDEVREKIEDAFRDVILSDSYWRIRYNAIIQLRALLRTPFDEKTISMLHKITEREGSWNRSAAISFLGATNDPKHADLYIRYLTDQSDRVVNAAANALGSSQSPLAYDALVKLIDKPSWKNQSLISSLNGLASLRDPRGAVIALNALADSSAAPRWTLATPVWDFRLAAANTLVALGKAQDGFPIVYEKYKRSLEENDINDIFSNVLLITTLGDPRGLDIFGELKNRFKDDDNAMSAILFYESQLTETLKAK